MINQELSLTTPFGYVPRLYSLHHGGQQQQQQQQQQLLACKENILEYNDGLGSSSSSSSTSFVSLRPKQQQQLYQYAVGSGYHQQQHLEVGGECISDEVVLDALTPGNNPHPASLSSEYRGSHTNFHQSQFLSASLGYSGHAQSGHAAAATTTSTTNRLQQTHFRRMKITQLMTCDSLDSSGVSTPLPHLQWVRSADLWRTMRSKDSTKAAPEAELRLHHPEILSNMRIILLDWIMEVGGAFRSQWVWSSVNLEDSLEDLPPDFDLLMINDYK